MYALCSSQDIITDVNKPKLHPQDVPSGLRVKCDSVSLLKGSLISEVRAGVAFSSSKGVHACVLLTFTSWCPVKVLFVSYVPQGLINNTPFP